MRYSLNCSPIFLRFWGILILLLGVVAVNAQTISVTGTVTDAETGETVIGVNIIESGTKKGTVTDINGVYNLSGIPSNSQLTLSAIGYETLHLNTNGRTLINVKLVPAIESLEELIVIGYGTVRKKDLTGSVAAISQKDINKSILTSPEQILQGNAAGVHVVTTSAEPGGDVAIRVRGSSSISGGNEPLIVIDNIPSDKSAFSALSVNDIESMDILKDASATAIYGSRGANGVVMITTKKGQTGKARVSVDAKMGISEPKNLLPMMNAEQFIFYDNIGRLSRGVNSLNKNYPGEAGVGQNYMAMLVDNGYRNEYNVQISGGSDNTTYFISTNLQDVKGLLKNSYSTRFGVRGKFNLKLHKDVDFQINTSASRAKNQKISGGDNGAMVRAAGVRPTTSIPDGSYFQDGFFIDSETGELTSVGDVTGKTISILNYERPFKFDISGQLNWRILPELTFMTRGAWQYSDEMRYLYEPRYSQSSPANIDKNNKARRTSYNRDGWLNENTLNYIQTFNEKHNFNALAGVTFEHNKREDFYAQVNKFETDDYLWNNLGAGLLNPVMNSGSNMYSLVSFLGRVMYDFDSRYFITGTFRSDGSSRFGSSNKYGYFPSVALAWNIKNEEWLKKSDLLSRMKVRATYGISGNDDISQYTSMSLLDDNKVLIGGAESIGNVLDQIGNSNIKWETTHQYNTGLDLGFFQNRITLGVDLYYKITKNLLYEYRLPLTTGYSSIMSNIGRVDNKGLEIELSSHNISSRKFHWVTDFNIGFNDSKVVDLGDNDKVVLYRGNGMMKVDIVYLQKGQPLNVLIGHEVSTYKNWEEVYDNDVVYYENPKSLKTIPGMPKYQDTNGDGVITDADMVVLGITMPKTTFGLTNTFTYGQFDLSVFINGAFGNSVYNGNSGKLFTFQTNNNNQYRMAMDSYRNMNALIGDPGYSDGKFPIPIHNKKGPVSSQTAYTSTMNSNYVEDASYLRLKSLSLSYRFPVKYLKAIKLSGLSVGLNATNLLTFTNYSGMDPEMSSTEGSSNSRIGVDRSAYPAFKSYTFTMNVNF